MKFKTTIIATIFIFSSVILIAQQKKVASKITNPNVAILNKVKKEFKFVETISLIRRYQQYVDTICNGNITHIPNYLLVNGMEDYEKKIGLSPESSVSLMTSITMFETDSAYYIRIFYNVPYTDEMSLYEYIFDPVKKLVAYSIWTPGVDSKIIFDKSNKVIFNEVTYADESVKSKLTDLEITKAKSYNDVLKELKFKTN